MVISLSSELARPRGIPQVQKHLNQLGKVQAQGQGGGQRQPSIGDQAVVVEGDLDAVGVI